MTYIPTIKRDGTVRHIPVEKTVQPKEKLNYNELAKYHKEMAVKLRENGRRAN